MNTMKKTFFIILLMATSLMMEAQQPLFLSNHDYTQKLDSVVGSDNFGWTNWKNCYTYGEDTITEISYEWQNQAWVPTARTLRLFTECDGQQLLESVFFEQMTESGWESSSKSTYEYDDQCHLLLNMYYNSVDTLGNWLESSKYEYVYNEAGLLDTCLYFTIRNGSWREQERTAYSYNEEQQCIGVLAQRKGGWGPFANTWMDSYSYEFEYENGELLSEYYYVSAGGWFGGGEMVLDGKKEYVFDAKGNLMNKTVSIYNGDDWIVRDVYENHYDLSVDASKVQGLEPFWQSILQRGMGYASGTSMPLNSQWLSCSIISSEYDTEFTLYCSGFAEVNEQQEEVVLRAYSFDGCLVVENPEPADVMVYDLLGRVVAQKSQASKCEFNLTSGLYIVSVGNARMKVIVK